MFDNMPNAEQRARAINEQMRLSDELWEVVERNLGPWEHDESMDDKVIAAILMGVATTFGGNILGMVASAMNMKRGALEGGAEIVKKGMLATARMMVDELDEAELDEIRH